MKQPEVQCVCSISPSSSFIDKHYLIKRANFKRMLTTHVLVITECLQWLPLNTYPENSIADTMYCCVIDTGHTVSMAWWKNISYWTNLKQTGYLDCALLQQCCAVSWAGLRIDGISTNSGFKVLVVVQQNNKRQSLFSYISTIWKSQELLDTT